MSLDVTESGLFQRLSSQHLLKKLLVLVPAGQQ